MITNPLKSQQPLGEAMIETMRKLKLQNAKLQNTEIEYPAFLNTKLQKRETESKTENQKRGGRAFTLQRQQREKRRCWQWRRRFVAPTEASAWAAA